MHFVQKTYKKPTLDLALYTEPPIRTLTEQYAAMLCLSVGSCGM